MVFNGLNYDFVILIENVFSVVIVWKCLFDLVVFVFVFGFEGIGGIFGNNYNNVLEVVFD